MKPLGFFAHPALEGKIANFGLEDEIRQGVIQECLNFINARYLRRIKPAGRQPAGLAGSYQSVVLRWLIAIPRSVGNPLNRRPNCFGNFVGNIFDTIDSGVLAKNSRKGNRIGMPKAEVDEGP